MTTKEEDNERSTRKRKKWKKNKKNERKKEKKEIGEDVLQRPCPMSHLWDELIWPRLGARHGELAQNVRCLFAL